jgi:hypothetical protein
VYQFTHTDPNPTKGLGAYHTSEIEYVFNNLWRNWTYTAVDRQVADTMSSYWVNFAATGGTTYFFLVAQCCGVGGSGGGSLHFTVQTVSAPTNDNFADAKPIPAPPKPKLTPVPPGTKRGVNPQAGVAGATGKPTSQGWITPRPGYPFQARKLNLTGSGGVRVTTDATGRVISAEMSPGIHPLLDQAAISFARSSWKGPPNTTRVVPITFILQ